uniref:Large ribosomal subunit protein bL9c n=1 Tax=Tetradesmus obliquus TaxID=3088 RepID=A0A383V847_TETOB|eukprot:jgi/Sobl393_1/13756/SZX61755.1
MLQQGHSGALLLLSACKALHNAVASVSCAGVRVAAQQEQLLPLAATAGALQQQHRHKHTVRMVLLQDHEKLGKQGDIVTVKAGHARYTLFPQGIADYAIPSVVRDMKAQGLLSEQGLLKLRGGGKQAAAAAVVDAAKLPPEQQLPQIIDLLHSKHVVIGRRFNQQHPEQPMLGEVTAQHLAACAAKQLHVSLPPELILMHSHSPIKAFGSFKVPLNLKDAEGQQVELEVEVNRTRRSSRVRQHKLRLFGGQQEKAGAGAAAAGVQPAA